MRVFSHVVVVDFGFAPNPFHGALTLACCKPKIREHAEPGDLIIGLTGASRGNRVVFAAEVGEKLTFNQYWTDRRFRPERLDMSSKDMARRRGDNIYGPLSGGWFREVRRVRWGTSLRRGAGVVS